MGIWRKSAAEEGASVGTGAGGEALPSVLTEVITAGQAARRIELERQRLECQMSGAWATVRRFVVEDPDLAMRLEAAIAGGLPVPDLSEVSAYRRLAHVDELLGRFEAARAGGPCAFCGSAKRRHDGSDRWAGHLESGWESYDGRVACGWCRHVLSKGGVGKLKMVVFAAAGSVRLWSGWRDLLADPKVSTFVPFFFELSEPAAPGRPWEHISVPLCRAVAGMFSRGLIGRASDNDVPGLPDLQLLSIPGKAIAASIPGIDARAWSDEDLALLPPAVVASRRLDEVRPGLAWSMQDARLRRRLEEEYRAERRELEAKHEANLEELRRSFGRKLTKAQQAQWQAALQARDKALAGLRSAHQAGATKALKQLEEKQRERRRELAEHDDGSSLPVAVPDWLAELGAR